MSRLSLISPLDDILLSYPCPVDWESMEGDDYKRYCDKCDLNVYNISAMSKEDAESFLGAEEGACIRFYRRADGTIKTAGCGRYYATIRSGARTVLRTAASLLVAVFSCFLSGFNLSASGSLYASDAKLRDLVKQKGKRIPGYRKRDLDEFYVTMGVITSSSSREILKLLLNYRSVDSSAENDKALGEFRSHLKSSRAIDVKYLKPLRKQYAKSNSQAQLFLTDLLEAALNDENPDLPEAERCRRYYEFEAVRQTYLDKLLAEMESAQHRKNSSDTDELMERFLLYCSYFGESKRHSVPLPDGLRCWRFNHARPVHCIGLYKSVNSVVASEDQMRRALRIARQNCKSDELNPLSLELEAAILKGQQVTPKDPKDAERLYELEGKLELVLPGSKCRTVYSVEAINSKVEDHGDDYFYVQNEFAANEHLFGKPILTEVYLNCSQKTYFMGDGSGKIVLVQELKLPRDRFNKEDRESLRGYLLEKGSRWIFLSNYVVDAVNEVQGKVLMADTPENRTYIRGVFEHIK